MALGHIFYLFYFTLSYECEGSEVVPITALRKTTTERQKNSTKKNSGEFVVLLTSFFP